MGLKKERSKTTKLKNKIEKHRKLELKT